MELKELTKFNVPEFLRTSDNLVAYLESVGIFLDGTKEAIEQFKYTNDYENGTVYNIELTLRELGYEVPPELAENIKRLVLRDAIETFIKKGTEDTLVWVLKVIGLEPEIKYAWLLTPDEVCNGYIRDPITQERQRYDVDKFAYTDFLYGKEKVTADGVFFEGYKYEDFKQENPIKDIPIVGQRYKKAPRTSLSVAKTPYAIVRIVGGDYNTVTDPYVGEDGNIYEYSQQEKFQIVNELIDYFLYKVARPTNVKVIIIVTLQELDDDFTVTDELEQETEIVNPYPEEQDDAEITDVFEGNGSLLRIFRVGEPIVVGFQSPYASNLSIMPTLRVGEIEEVNEVYVENWDTATFDFNIYPSNEQPVRPYTELEFDVPAGVTGTVYATYVYGDRSYDPMDTSDDYELFAPDGDMSDDSEVSTTAEMHDGTFKLPLATLNSGAITTVNIMDTYHGVYIELDGADSIPVSVSYKNTL